MESLSTINRPFILNIYKPPGIGSTKVVGRIKRALGKSFKKIGHFGTLDPFAEGVLLIGGNGACRLNDFLHERYPKTYLATGKLGFRTNTGDLEGEVVEESTIPELSSEKINSVLQSFLGEYLQSPPAFSATKHQGKALYKWAREGVEIKKEPVKREIYSIEFVEFKGDEVQFRVTVSTGTYIRTLFEDVAEKLETKGHLVGLKRESIGFFNFQDSLKEDSWPGEEAFDASSFLKLQDCFNVSVLTASDKELKLYSHGNPVEIDRLKSTKPLLEGELGWIQDPDGNLLGLGKACSGLMTSCFNFPYTPR